MPEQRYWVIFDSNIYRGRTRNCTFDQMESLASRIRGLERSRGIQATASPVVVLELVAHLLDDGDESKRCRNAIAFLANHVREDAEKGHLHMVRSDSELVCHALFNVRIEKAEEIRSGLGRLANEISRTSDGHVDPNWHEFIVSARVAKEATEQSWLEEFKAARLIVDPWAPDFLFDGAKASVHRIAKSAGIDLKEHQLAKVSAKFVELFTVTAELGRNLYLSFPPGNTINEAKFVNSLWDLYLSYAFGPSHTIKWLPILFVTEDKIFERALHAARASETVQIFDWNGYKKFIGL
ncbi:MAG: hypothetical protein IPL86_18535 [Flavobacteriales bacterium]|nr:hypothetical protein [Flavobacteriales bacterium]